MISDDELLAITQAHKEGKRIQWTWFGKLDHDWQNLILAEEWGDFRNRIYRVAPEITTTHLISGYCFARDISDKPLLGMIKVQQVELEKCENPIGRKPRDWWLDFKGYGGNADVYMHNYCGDCVHVREVIE